MMSRARTAAMASAVASLRVALLVVGVWFWEVVGVRMVVSFRYLTLM